jgi:subtilisin-like proprotein convertase family protein
VKNRLVILLRSSHQIKHKIGSLWVAAFALLWCFSAMGQAVKPVNEWTHLSSTPADKVGAARWVQPLRGELFRLEHATIREKLATVARGEPSAAKGIGTEIELPMPDGTTARFVIVEAPVMAPELAAKFPEIKTYAGQGIDDPSATVRLDFSPAGFHAQVLSPRGAVYVDPAYRGDADYHVSYYKRDYSKALDDWNCLAEGSGTVGKALSGSTSSGIGANKVQSGTTLRTYRLAVACTGEYAAYFGGTVSNAMAAIVSAVNRVDGVYETELAVRLVLIANNNLIVYTNSSTDPYSNNNESTMLGQNQTTLDSVIGSANYDIGHVFSTGGGGIAMLGCVCFSSYKAQGVTGSSAPTGDAFWIDYVAHEMGHQFGANHTFNAVTGSCGGGNRNASTAFEPGSGLTIMAYAGICSPNDLQPHGDPYFHAGSLDEIQTYLSTGGGGGCAVTSATGNSAPTISAGVNYTIPASTPFVLTATGSDPNGDALTYCWEEMDAGAAAALTDADNGSMALFRNMLPTNSPVRYVPKLSSVLANTNWNQEKLPTTSRTMKFRVTARDNRAGGGGVADSDITVTSVSGAGPFVVTSPNTAINWFGLRTVTWNVAGTASSPINASGVNIYLSTNSGLSFPFRLAANVPNNGSAEVVLPNLFSSQARIMVQGAGNIFYDVSDVDFSVSPIGPLVQLSGTSLVAESCVPTNDAVDPYETVTVNWSLFNAGNAPTTNLVATLLATNGVYYPGAAQNYGAISAGGTVTRAFTFTPAGVCGGSVTGLVQLADGAANMGSVATVFTLGVVQTTVVTQVFNNASTITIVDVASASPYPSTISVSGVSTPVTKVTATINGWSHTYPSDVGILLVGPGGQKVKLVGGAGGGTPVNGVVLTFDDAAGGPLSTSAISSGTYLPTDLSSSDVFNSLAPSSPYGSTLAPLTATPNGTWSLYVQDFVGGDFGSISDGWSLRFVTASSTTNCCTTFPPPTLTTTTYSNSIVRFNWSAMPGPHYQVQYRTNLAVGAWQNLGSSILGTNTTMGITDIVSNSPIRFYRVLVEP